MSEQEQRIPYSLLKDTDEQIRCIYTGWGNGYHAARQKNAIDEVDSDLIKLVTDDWGGVPQSATFRAYDRENKRFWLTVYFWNYEMGYCFGANPARTNAVPGVPFKPTFSVSQWGTKVPHAVLAGWVTGRNQFWRQYYDTNSAEIKRVQDGILVAPTRADMKLM